MLDVVIVSYRCGPMVRECLQSLSEYRPARGLRVTVVDNALTRPWIVTKRYLREQVTRPYWREVNCSENNNHVKVGRENYMISADGLLMPTKRGQSPPDLRYFNQVRK